ncbi:MAG: hypothetical protein ACI9BF_000187 [Candidatus Paceibacteria bacterium]
MHITLGASLLVSDIPSLSEVTGPDRVTFLHTDDVKSLRSVIIKVLTEMFNKTTQSEHLKEVSLLYT